VKPILYDGGDGAEGLSNSRGVGEGEVNMFKKEAVSELFSLSIPLTAGRGPCTAPESVYDEADDKD
jgi:hypothetical protein